MSRKLLLFGLLVFFVSGLAHAAIQVPDQLKEIPVFPDSKITQAMDMQTACTATFKVKANADAVLDFYRQGLKSKGWKIVFQAEQEDSAVISFSSDKKMLQLSVNKGSDDGTLEYILVLSAGQ